ncbi:MAG: hypothetical protein NVS1B9_05060 [Solirubrobacteraceae bacterium]
MILLVSLGATAGLRAADEELRAGLQRAGAAVELVAAQAPREMRTLALTDLAWARAARAAALVGIREHEPRAVIYSSSTAALLWPRSGAIRFDSTAAVNRPGRHGLWQRPVERRRLRQASLLLPWSEQGTGGIVLPVPVEPSGAPAAQRDVAAITYAANPHKKGLDRVLSAWARARRPGEELLVAGVDRLPVAERDGVRLVGRLERARYRALLRRARVFVTAPRREDHGIAQLEALADGCRLVSTVAPGPYVALSIARRLDPRLVGDDLAAGLRAALDAPAGDNYSARAAVELRPLRRAAVDRVIAEQVLPALLSAA